MTFSGVQRSMEWPFAAYTLVLPGEGLGGKFAKHNGDSWQLGLARKLKA